MPSVILKDTHWHKWPHLRYNLHLYSAFCFPLVKVKSIYTRQCYKSLAFHSPLMHQSQYKLLPTAPLETREDTKQVCLCDIWPQIFQVQCLHHHHHHRINYRKSKLHEILSGNFTWKHELLNTTQVILQLAPM